MTHRRRPNLVWIAALSAAAAGCNAPTGTPVAAVAPIARLDNARWMQRFEVINDRARHGDIDLLFVGDSITEEWKNNGREVWDEYYGSRKTANAGVGGDRTQHVLWRLDHGNVDGIRPKVAVVLIGTNNVSDGCSSEEVAAGVTAVVRRLRAKLPATRILLLAVFPRGERPGAERQRVADANRRIRRLASAPHITYMDIGTHFLNPDGSISADVMYDYLHLTPLGYRVWATAIEGKLRELMAEPP